MAMGTVACDVDAPGTGARRSAHSALTEAGESGDVLYAVEQVLDAEGRVLEVNEAGELTAELRARAARPWLHPGQDAVDSEAFDIPDGEGRRRGYRLLRGEVVPRPARDDAEVLVDPRLQALLAVAPPDELVPVSFFLRGWPAWDVPLAPPTGGMSAEDREEAEAARATAIARREAMIQERGLPLQQAIEAAGGRVSGLGWGTGWVMGEVPAGAIPGLLEREDVRRAALEDAVPKDAALPLGDAGAIDLAGNDLLTVYGYTGERPSGRNSYGDITIAIGETSGLEDEAKFLCDTGAGCPGDSRLRQRLSCTNPDTGNLGTCDPVGDFAEASEGDHGTWVASIALGDYTDGQCDGFYCGDSTTSHSAEWKDNASGVAQEASLVFFNGLGGGNNMSGLAEVFTDSVSLGVDIISLSLEPDAVCRVKTTTAAEAELETAYQDGIFVASCAGNAGHATDCAITSPSGIPSAFTVGGLSQEGGFFGVPCEQYPDCRVMMDQSRLGGGDVKGHLGNNMVASQSMMDMVAPSMLTHATDSQNAYGEVSGPGAWTEGCSFATPFVAGTAAVIKDMFIAQSASWINDPGRLHTVMMAMGDRYISDANGDGIEHDVGADRRWGFGKLRTRALHAWGGIDPYGYQQNTVSFVPSSPTWSSNLNGGAPLQAGTSVVKCVMHQTELMESKDRVSNVDLQIQLWAPAGGSCASPGFLSSTTDTTTDTQALVAVDSSVAGKCARVRLLNQGIITAGVTVHTFCYLAGRDDDENL